MGRKKGDKFKPRKCARHRTERSDDKNVWGPVAKENVLLETFYKSQNIIPVEEWSNFMEAIRRELPVAFRITGYRKEALHLLEIMQSRYLSKFDGIVIDGVEVESPTALAWYPGKVAFQMKVARKIVRKSHLLHNFHNFLVTETELGHASRQETVSMIPPLLLDVKPCSKVLDMCAAPGSKTAQIIELLHADESVDVPTGFVVANDSDNKRCYLLVHQALKRLQSPCCLITNHDATTFPKLRILEEEGGSGCSMSEKDLLFDRVLCDVPCSGDGTLRKNFDVWKKWNINQAYGLHNLQIRIAKRGLELLAVGGRLVYSTCSLNPIEDEAVLVQLLEFAQGSVELADVSDELPGLRRVAGISTWKIMSKQGEFFDTCETLSAGLKTQICPTAFPPKDTELAKSYHLERSFRILPHHQDTGGFFVAVLRKTKPFPWQLPKIEKLIRLNDAKLENDKCETSTNETTIAESPKSDPPTKRRKRQFFGFKEDPFLFLATEKDITMWEQIREFFGIDEQFRYQQLLGRCKEETTNSDDDVVTDVKLDDKQTDPNAIKGRRNLYFVSDQIRSLMTLNEGRVKFVNAGVRVFGRAEQKAAFRFRLAQEGIHILMPFLSKRKIKVSVDDIKMLLLSKLNCNIKALSESVQKDCELDNEGSNVFYTYVNDSVMAICGWKGKYTVGALVAREERIHLLRMLDVDTTELEGEMKSNRKRKDLVTSGFEESKPEEPVGNDDQDEVLENLTENAQ